MRSRFIVTIIVLVSAMPFLGCLMYNALWRVRLYFSETPKIIYEDLGVVATEWGTQLVHRVEFDLSNVSITDVVYSVNGKKGMLFDRSNSVVVPTLGVNEWHKFIEGGESWEVSLCKYWSSGCTNDGCVARVNNCSKDTVIHVRMNEMEFVIPCGENDFVRKLGTNYCKTVVRGML